MEALFSKGCPISSRNSVTSLVVGILTFTTQSDNVVKVSSIGFEVETKAETRSEAVSWLSSREMKDNNLIPLYQTESRLLGLAYDFHIHVPSLLNCDADRRLGHWTQTVDVVLDKHRTSQSQRRLPISRRILLSSSKVCFSAYGPYPVRCPFFAAIS